MQKLYEPKEISEIMGLDGQVMRKLLYDYEDVVQPTAYKNYPVDGRSGYKLYDTDAVDKLRQIVIYRELGLKHGEIKAIFSNPAYDSNQALSEQLNLLKEKREQINRRIEAVERMQAIGIKNGILQLILPDGSIKELLDGSNSVVSQRVVAMIEDKINNLSANDTRLDDFFSKIEPVVNAYAKLDDSLCESVQGMDLIEKMVSISKKAFGFIGYISWLCIALSAHGEGTMWREIDVELEYPLSFQKYQAIFRWLLNDAKAFDTELKSLARRHNCIGLPFHDNRSISFVADVRSMAREHFSLETDEEYMLVLSTMNIPPYKHGDGYALYTLNALKYDINSHSK